MRGVDHLAGELHRPGIRIGGEGGHDGAGVRQFLFTRGERRVDDRDLGGMNSHYPRKPVAPRTRGVGGKPAQVLERRIDRLDRSHTGSMCSK